MKPKNIIISIVSILFLIVLLQNTQVVTLRFLFWDFAMSRIILIPVVFLTGLGSGFLLGKKI